MLHSAMLALPRSFYRSNSATLLPNSVNKMANEFSFIGGSSSVLAPMYAVHRQRVWASSIGFRKGSTWVNRITTVPRTESCHVYQPVIPFHHLICEISFVVEADCCDDNLNADFRNLFHVENLLTIPCTTWVFHVSSTFKDVASIDCGMQVTKRT